MYTAQQLCERISNIFPDLGSCNEDITVDYDSKTETWLVHLNDGTHSLSHYLELPDADACLSGKQCVSLGLEMAQMKHNIHGEQF
ncbi:hypothetical protein [Desulfogranum japonicum]|uniref:hypothetical protein n=1 Tax=Desulfogranum japonicum TaxID=231447 RepID=UPI0003FAE26A|nr:hypothetical protein [Desulfogranum japonicum]